MEIIETPQTKFMHNLLNLNGYMLARFLEGRDELMQENVGGSYWHYAETLINALEHIEAGSAYVDEFATHFITEVFEGEYVKIIQHLESKDFSVLLTDVLGDVFNNMPEILKPIYKAYDTHKDEY